MIVAGIRYHRNKQKLTTVACAICRKEFAHLRSTARFCSPRCRQRAHRRAGLSPVDELRNAKGCSKRSVVPTRVPYGSGVDSTLRPSSKTGLQQPEPISGSLARSSTLRLTVDQHWPNMWRIAFPDGRLSDLVNLTRAKEALRRASVRAHELTARTRARES